MVTNSSVLNTSDLRNSSDVLRWCHLPDSELTKKGPMASCLQVVIVGGSQVLYTAVKCFPKVASNTPVIAVPSWITAPAVRKQLLAKASTRSQMHEYSVSEGSRKQIRVKTSNRNGVIVFSECGAKPMLDTKPRGCSCNV